MQVEADLSVESDDALMAQVAGRSSGAFRQLAARHGRLPFQIGWRMLGDATEAEDIAQEALLRLWDHAGRWKAGGPGVAAWLKRVAMNLCLDRLRRRKFGSDEEAPERADDSPLADALLDEDRMADIIKAAMGALPDRQRAAIVLTYYEELTNMAAAQAMDMNIKAFESLLLRARAGLRNSLEAAGILSPFVEAG